MTPTSRPPPISTNSVTHSLILTNTTDTSRQLYFFTLLNHFNINRIFHTVIHFTQLSCQLSQSVSHHLSTIYGCHVSVRVIKIIRQTSYGCPASQFATLISQTSYGCPASQFAALGPSRPDPLPPVVVCWPLRREPDMKVLFRSDLENFCGLF